jgi:diguanylate cyclase (GGDEF)-like protein/PAS domain S-box-containing protein
VVWPASSSRPGQDSRTPMSNEQPYHPLPAGAAPGNRHFRTLVDAMPQQVWSARANGELDYVNRRVVDYFGLPADDILGGGWISLVHPDDQAETLRRWRESLHSGEGYEINFRLRRADGSYRWHLGMALPLRDLRGNITHWVGTNTDITTHKETELALAHSETRLASAQERALIGSWELDIKTNTRTASAELFQIIGRDPAMGVPNLNELLASVHPDDLEAVLASRAQTLVDYESNQLDFRLLLPSGDIRWIELRSQMMLDAQGAPLRVTGTVQDITERKQAETALQESEARLAAAQARAKMGSWRRDLASGEATWSAEMYRLFRRDPSLKPPSFADFMRLIHAEDRHVFLAQYQRYIREGNGYQIDFRVPQPDGSLMWIEARSETQRDSNGKAIVLSGTAQDITDRKQAELALNASESRFRAFMEKSPAIAFIKDEAGRFVYINPTFERVFQLAATEIIGKTAFDLWPTDVAQRLQDQDAAIFAASQAPGKQEGHQTEALEEIPTAVGMRHWLSAKFVFNNANGQRFLGCTAIDLTDHHNAEQALRTSTQLLNMSQKVARLGGWELDVRTQEVFWTDEIYRLLDTSPQEITPTLASGLDYVVPSSRERLETVLERAIKTGEGFDLELEMNTYKGRRIDVRVTCAATMEGATPVKLNGIFQDISEQKAAQLALVAANRELERANQRLEHIAHYDALTHLPNRVLLADRMQQALAQSQRRQQSLAVAFIDLDGFKTINDQHGHAMGDQLLIAIALRMRAALREGDTLARIGGDEFVVVLTDLSHASDCEPLVDRLLAAAAEPITLNDTRLEVSASIGVTIYPQDGVDAEQLLRHADQAMYLAKQAGKNCFHLFDVAKDVAVKNQRESLEHIRSALDNHEFVLYYQPKVNMRTGEVVGAEALIRWQHPLQGLLPPGAFLPAIENHQISIELGEWVITTALGQMAHWQKQGLTLPVSVNISALQLQHANFIERLQLLLEDQPQAQHLELEILETSALEDITQVSRVIHSCQQLGVSFALDDFGTGYSSLAYLKRLPAHLLKIDQSFVRDMLDDPDDLTIIKGIIGLATAFRRQVIAEGVETIAHGESLLAIGCELAQGYGIARPMPAADIPGWVSNWQPDPAWRPGKTT